MKKIRFMLEYGCSPIWVLNDDTLICVGLPEDLSQNQELKELLESISIEYDSLFINNSIEFSYKGFLNDESEKNFDNKVKKAIKLLREAAKNKYIIEIANEEYESDII